jgi:hypothetical protein
MILGSNPAILANTIVVSTVMSEAEIVGAEGPRTRQHFERKDQ